MYTHRLYRHVFFIFQDVSDRPLKAVCRFELDVQQFTITGLIPGTVGEPWIIYLADRPRSKIQNFIFLFAHRTRRVPLLSGRNRLDSHRDFLSLIKRIIL